MASARDRVSRTGHRSPSPRHGKGAVVAGKGSSAAESTKVSAARLRSIRDALSNRQLPALDPETQVLMLRQLAVERMVQGRPADALQITARMLGFGVLSELGHHEAGRAHAMMQAHDQAAACDLLAARVAPAEQRSFFWWSAAIHLEHDHQLERALEALRRALRWSSRAGRPLYRAHAAVLRLESGQSVRQLGAIITALQASPQAQGYGGYLLGRLALHQGRKEDAAHHFEAFLSRHASSDPALRISLARELADAAARLRPDAA